MSDLTRYSPTRSLFERRRRFSPFNPDDRWDETRWDLFSLFPLSQSAVFDPWDRSPLRELYSGSSLETDLYEEEDRLVLKASLPGVREKDIEVFEQDGFLTLRVRNEEKVKRDQAGWRVQAQHYGVWQRSFQLPAAVNVDRSKAVLKDGVLTVSLPKREPRQNLIHRIKVKTPKLKLPGFLKKSGRVQVRQANE